MVVDEEEGVSEAELLAQEEAQEATKLFKHLAPMSHFAALRIVYGRASTSSSSKAK